LPQPEQKKPECQPGKFAGLAGIETGFAVF
jgi:hypothetical protein